MKSSTCLGDRSNTAPAVALLRPGAFGYNPQTAESNPMQGSPQVQPAALAQAAQAEHKSLVDALLVGGARAIVLEDSLTPPKPDALFLNNWVSTHADGTAILYPMQAPIRRSEVRPELLTQLRTEHGVRIERVIDLTSLAEQGSYLEGTGSLVLDRRQGIAFACRSPRTTEAGLQAFHEATGYEIHAFDATDSSGRPYYHTNVMLSVGERVALAALDSLPDRNQRDALRAALTQSGRELIPLSRSQVESFAGNALELQVANGGTALVLSTRSWEALDAEQRQLLTQTLPLITTPFATIERIGGGGIRCALAAIHCPLD